MIEREKLEQMFGNIAEQGQWDMSQPMLWGYFFTHGNADDLRGLVSKLQDRGYEYVDLWQSEMDDSSDDFTWWLHVQRVEVHSVDSLYARNEWLTEFAVEHDIDSYDGMDVGPVESAKRPTHTAREIPSADVDAWTLTKGERDGRLSLIRFRPGLKSFLGDPRYPRRLQVTWSFDDDEKSGMPSEEISNSMSPMEDRVVHALEAVQAGVLVFVVTHCGKREWHYYVAESADLGALINEALSELPRLPIELQIEDDAEWTEFAQVLNTVRERTPHT